MKVTFLLADSAQAVNGKLYILGGGWSVTGPQPGPSALALKIEVPWNEANRKHEWRATLEDQDGTAVTVPTPAGDQPVEVGGEFEVGRPPGVIEGTPLDLPIAVNIGPLPLQPGGRYCWRLQIDDETRSDWSVGFTVRSTAASGVGS